MLVGVRKRPDNVRQLPELESGLPGGAERLDRGGRLQAEELVPERRAQSAYGKSGLLKKPGERDRTEVGAVLVNDVPDPAAMERVEAVGHLEENHGLAAIPNGAAKCQKEFPWAVEVFQNVPAANKLCRVAGVSVSVDVADHGDALPSSAPVRGAVVARIEAEATSVSHLAEQGQELPLSTSNLDDILIPEVVFLDQACGQSPGIGLEAWGEVEGVLIGPGVVCPAGIEGNIGDHSARPAEAEPDITSGSGEGSLPAGPEDVTVNRNILHLKENNGIFVTADRAIVRMHNASVRQDITGPDDGEPNPDGSKLPWLLGQQRPDSSQAVGNKDFRN
jgi:hypothetical protein